jgi:NADPH-dependent 7-cyano-7-deazaguanine reductase QueF
MSCDQVDGEQADRVIKSQQQALKSIAPFAGMIDYARIEIGYSALW